jgi:hypothetical protein
MSKKTLTEKEKEFAERYVELYKIGVSMCESDISFTNERIKMISDIRKNHYEMKPLKIFRKSYKEWKEQLEYFDNKILDLYKELELCINDYTDLCNIPKNG